MKISSENKSKLNIAVIMAVLAVLAMLMATYAWFSLSLTTKVNTMDLEVTAGEHMRIDVRDRGNNIENWDKSEVTASDVEGVLSRQLSTYKILPVTSGNGKTFYTRQGREVAADELKYLQFVVWMISSVDVDVFLTEKDSEAGNDGTLVTSDSSNSTAQSDVNRSVRISFNDGSSGRAPIYAPDRSGNTTLTVTQAISDSSGGRQNHFTDADIDNSSANLFALKANESKKITITIWLEGDDADNDSDQEYAKFNTRLRFEGVE